MSDTPASAPVVAESAPAEGTVSAEGEQPVNTTAAAPAEGDIDEAKFLDYLKNKFKTKVKIKGQEREATWQDFEKNFSRGIASTETWEEAAKMRKEAEAQTRQFSGFVEQLKANPFTALSQLGIDPQQFRKAAEDYLYEEIQLDQNPHRRREIEFEKQRAEFERRQQDFQRQQQEAQLSQEASRYEASFKRDIPQALKAAGLEVKPHLVDAVIDQAKIALEANAPLDFLAIAENIRDQQNERNMQVMSMLRQNLLSKGDKIEILKESKKLLGDDVIKAIQEGLVAEVRQPGRALTSPTSQESPRQVAKRESKYESLDALRDKIMR